MQTQSNRPTIRTRWLSAAVGFALALTALLLVNFYCYGHLRHVIDSRSDAEWADELLCAIVVTDLFAVGCLCGLVVWLHRKLILRDAVEEMAMLTREAQETIWRERVEELVRANRRLQEEIVDSKRLSEKLGRVQKLEALGRVVGIVGHEFNNYLTVIIGFSEQLLQQVAAGSMEHSIVEEIFKAGERSAELTRGLLGLARPSDSLVKPLDFNQQVEVMRRMLGVVLGKRVRLQLALDATMPHVYAVPGQIEQVLLNLATNARDAMPEGGEVLIETKLLEVDGPNEGVAPGRYVLLCVSDTGQGMPSETQERLFEPFFSTKENGTGLGLATVREIVQTGGGGVAVESVVGRGTTFKVYWPTTHDAAADTVRNVHVNRETLHE